MRYFLIAILCLMTAGIMAQDFYDMDTVNTIELTFTQSNWDQLLDNLYSAGDEERLLGSVVVDGVAYDSVGVRYKGNSSYSSQYTKNPFNIKLDYIIDDQTHEGYGTLKLSNGHNDPSFIREAIGYEVAREYLPASKSNFANVYVNGTLIGLYSNVQDVDKKFKNEHFSSNNDIRFKGEVVGNGMPSEETLWGYEGADSTSYMSLWEKKSDTGWDDLIDFLYTLNNDNDTIEEHLNVDAHLWMLAYDNLHVNLDSPINFAHNYYLFKDETDRFHPIVWDLNESYGIFSMLLSGGNLSSTQLYSLNPLFNVNDTTYPILNKILNNTTYKKMYVAHMRTMIEEVYQSGWFEDRAFEIQDIIASSFQADNNMDYTYSQFTQNVTSSITTGGGPWAQTVVGLTQLMDARSTWLLQQSLFSGTVPELVNVAHSPESVFQGEEVTFTVDATDTNTLWFKYRTLETEAFTTIAMFDDGDHNDGQADDGNYGVTITADYNDIEYYFYAENSSLGKFLPAKAAYEFFTLEVTSETGDIVINEINYNSSDEFDAKDWVELYNPSAEALDISGWIFKDSDDEHSFEIPAATIIESNEYLVLSKNLEQFNLMFPAVTNVVGDFSFGLSGSGELIRLFDGNETLIDSVEYFDSEDWSELPDGNGNTLELIDPSLDNFLATSWQASLDYGTPGTANSTGVTGNDDSAQATVEMQLHNYPNPFNPTTTIEFSINNDSNSVTTLNIYNIKGQKVKSLLKSNLTNGNHNVVWNGSDDNGNSVSSGVYFYKLTSGNKSKTNRMILMK